MHSIHLKTTKKKKQILLALTAVAVSVTAYAGVKAPEKTSGISAEVAHINGLEAQIPAMSGYQLRGRKLTILPGGGTVEHSHAERPGIVVVLSGEIVEVRNGKMQVFKEGDTWIEKSDTNHFVLNQSDAPAVIWMVDMPIEE